MLPNAADKKNTCQQAYKTKAEMIIIYTLPNAVDKKKLSSIILNDLKKISSHGFKNSLNVK